MSEAMKLVLGWMLVGAFGFTTVVTCLSLVGWIRFADKSQQRKLFYALIVQLVVGAGATLFDQTRFDPTEVETTIRSNLLRDLDKGNVPERNVVDDGRP